MTPETPWFATLTPFTQPLPQGKRRFSERPLEPSPWNMGDGIDDLAAALIDSGKEPTLFVEEPLNRRFLNKCDLSPPPTPGGVGIV
jgi:hypothetical protein